MRRLYESFPPELEPFLSDKPINLKSPSMKPDDFKIRKPVLESP